MKFRISGMETQSLVLGGHKSTYKKDLQDTSSIQELTIYFPNGMARPKLSIVQIERTLKIPGTGRNWNSVTKLLELAERMEASERLERA